MSFPVELNQENVSSLLNVSDRRSRAKTRSCGPASWYIHHDSYHPGSVRRDRNLQLEKGKQTKKHKDAKAKSPVTQELDETTLFQIISDPRSCQIDQKRRLGGRTKCLHTQLQFSTRIKMAKGGDQHVHFGSWWSFGKKKKFRQSLKPCLLIDSMSNPFQAPTASEALRWLGSLSPTLEWISLRDKHHTDAELSELVDALLTYLDKVLCVDLRSNILTDETGVKLTRCLAVSTTIRVLSLSNNQFGEATYLALCTNTSLRELDLFEPWTNGKSKKRSRGHSGSIQTAPSNRVGGCTKLAGLIWTIVD